MHSDDQSRLPPSAGGHLAPREGEHVRDPLDMLTSGLGDNPALGELIAFRQGRPDLKEAARMARQFDNEAHRVAYAENPHPEATIAAAGLKLAALLFDSLVSVWPADSLDEADAKLALAQQRGPFGAD